MQSVSGARGESSMRVLWKKNAAWTAVGIAAIVSGLLSYLVVDTTLGKDVGGWGQVGLVALGVIGVLAALIASQEAPWQEKSLSAWLRPKPIAMMFVAIFGSFGLIAGVISLLAPRPAVEDRPRQIQTAVEHIRQGVDKLSTRQENARILKKLPGLWGEHNCTVIYKFSIITNALKIEGVRQPPKTLPLHEVATITSSHGDILESRGVDGKGRGIASTFTFTGNALFDSMIWDDQSLATPLQLVRCNA